MADHDWQPVDRQEGLDYCHKEGVSRLPISCQHYYYFGTSSYPVIKYDTVKMQFYGSEFYRAEKN